MAYNSTSWTTDANTKASSSGTTTMGGITLYSYFGIGSSLSSAYAAGYHYPLPFATNDLGAAGLEDNVHLGNDADPATSYTTSDNDTGSSVKANYVVGKLWFVPDNINIDAVTSIEGANNATGDVTRFHLFSYTFTSGSTSALSSGTLLAHSTDQTNAGDEQLYKNTWTIDSASVAADKVIVATWESDTINADYTLSVVVKYHLT